MLNGNKSNKVDKLCVNINWLDVSLRQKIQNCLIHEAEKITGVMEVDADAFISPLSAADKTTFVPLHKPI